MNILKKYISNKTENIRYKYMEKIAKILTPNLYRELQLIGFVGIKIPINFISKYPRPSIIMMKERFKQRLLIGVEIGVSLGLNAESILKELNIEKLYLIDIWINYLNSKHDKSTESMTKDYKLVLKKFRNNNKIEIIKDYSINAVKNLNDNSLDFVYIDGNHSYQYVYKDIEVWTPKVKIGGVIAGHDIFNCPDVFEAVKDFCFENKFRFDIKLPDWWFFK